MKFSFKNRFDNFKGYSIFVSDGIKELANSDKQKLTGIMALACDSLEDNEWGYVDKHIRKENWKTLIKNDGYIIGEYLYDCVLIYVICHIGDRIIEIYLSEED